MPEGFLEEDQFDDERLAGIAGAMRSSDKRARVSVPRLKMVLGAAVSLYPHISIQFPSPEDVGVMKVGGDVTELDKSRALRSVDLAFGMERVIRARIEREQEQ